MLKPCADLILTPDESRYSLVVAVAKRAREVAAEAEDKGTVLVEKPVDIAVDEFLAHKFKIIEPVMDNEEKE